MIPRWGCHVFWQGIDLAALLLEAQKQGQSCIQTFFGSSDSFSRSKLTDEDRKACTSFIAKNNFAFVTHFPYKLNMCNQDVSMGTLQSEIQRVAAIGGRVVLHTGSCTFSKTENRKVKTLGAAAKKEWEQDWKRGADILCRHLKSLDYTGKCEYPLLLEPPAGEGKKLGWTFEQLKYIYENAPKEVGFCLDTCHAFAAGMCKFDSPDSIMILWDNLRNSLGDMKRFKLIHLNDSQDEFGAMKDRHATLCEGRIWTDEGNRNGLFALFAMAGLEGVDVVSECGTERDAKVMKELADLIHELEV